MYRFPGPDQAAPPGGEEVLYAAATCTYSRCFSAEPIEQGELCH